MHDGCAAHLPQPGREQQEGISDMNESAEDEVVRLEALGFYPSALPNQVTAILNAGDRSDRVGQITAPTLVLHGAEDKLLSVEHGEHTARLPTLEPKDASNAVQSKI